MQKNLKNKDFEIFDIQIKRKSKHFIYKKRKNKREFLNTCFGVSRGNIENIFRRISQAIVTRNRIKSLKNVRKNNDYYEIFMKIN